MSRSPQSAVFTEKSQVRMGKISSPHVSDEQEKAVDDIISSHPHDDQIFLFDNLNILL